MDDMTKVLIETEQRSKSNTHRIDQLEEKVEDYGAMVTSIQVLGEKVQHMDADVKEIKTDVKALSDKPAKRWESIAKLVIETVVGAVIIYLLARMGISA